MVTKDDVMQILDLNTADFESLEGIAELQRRVEAAHGLLTEHKILSATDLLSGEDADDPNEILIELDAIIDDKRNILKNAACELKPIAWNEIQVPDSREWLIQKWLPANTVTMFTGQGGAGKSWLTLQIACQIASPAKGMAWGNPNYKIPKPSEYDDSIENEPKHIVFATYEDEPAEIKRRLNALTSAFDWVEDQRTVIQKHLHIVDMRGIGSIWGPGLDKHISVTGELLRSGEALRSVCEGLNASLLVLDPLSGAFGGNENDRTAVYDFVSSFRGWGDAAKCAMLVIGHLPKTQGVGFSGSTAWEASARAMWMLSKKEHNPDKDTTEYYYALEHTKSNYAMKQNDIYLVKNNDYGWWNKVETDDEAIDGYNALEEYQQNKATSQETENELTNF